MPNEYAQSDLILSDLLLRYAQAEIGNGYAQLYGQISTAISQKNGSDVSHLKYRVRDRRNLSLFRYLHGLKVLEIIKLITAKN